MFKDMSTLDSFNQAKQQDRDNVIYRVTHINRLRNTNFTGIVPFMNYIEELLNVCGAEKKVTFTEVSSTLVKVFTRVPMSVNIFPFMPDDENNIRFHKVITQVLIEKEQITGVRWLPNQNGVEIAIGLNFDKKEE